VTGLVSDSTRTRFTARTGLSSALSLSVLDSPNTDAPHGRGLLATQARTPRGNYATQLGGWGYRRIQRDRTMQRESLTDDVDDE